VEETSRGTRRSLQFFDRQGVAIHKIYLTDQSDIGAFDGLVAQFATAATPLDIAAAPAPKAALPDGDIDVARFRTRWDEMKDTHDFHGLLTSHKVQRLQGLRLAGAERARAVPVTALRTVL